MSDEITQASVVEGLRTSKDVSAELSRLHEKKHSIEQKLQNLEKQIFALEGTYLMDTRHLGNILTGWENYLTARSGALKRASKFKESDRLFSLSSATSMRPEKQQEQSNKSASSAEYTHASFSPGAALGYDGYDPNSFKSQKLDKRKGPGRPRKIKSYDDDEYTDL